MTSNAGTAIERWGKQHGYAWGRDKFQFKQGQLWYHCTRAEGSNPRLADERLSLITHMHVQRRAPNHPFGAGFYDGTSGIPGLTSPTDKLWAHHMEAWHVPPAMLTSRNATDWHREPWRRPPTYTDDGLRPGDAPRHLFCVVRHPVCRVIAQFRSGFNRHSRGCSKACGLEEWLSDAHLNEVAGPFPRAVHGLAVVPWYSSGCRRTSRASSPATRRSTPAAARCRTSPTPTRRATFGSM